MKKLFCNKMSSTLFFFLRVKNKRINTYYWDTRRHVSDHIILWNMDIITVGSLVAVNVLSNFLCIGNRYIYLLDRRLTS